MAQDNIKVAIVFGERATSDLENGEITEEVVNGLHEYEFATQAEVDAFFLGIKEASGWMSYSVPDEEDLAEIRLQKSQTN